MNRKEANELLVKLPTWAFILDKEHNVVARNSTADALGLAGKKKCFGVGNRSEKCKWCAADAAFENEDNLSANLRVNLDPNEWAIQAKSGGFHFDAHYIKISDDSNLLLHFGFIGLLPEEKREEALNLIKQYVGEVPATVKENVDKTIEELVNNEFNPLG